MNRHPARINKAVVWTMAAQLIVAFPSSVTAQYARAEPLSTPVPLDPAIALQDHASSTGLLVGAGLLGAVIGFVGGAFAGGYVEQRFFPCSCDDPGLAGAVLGTFVGSALVVPLAVHAANDRRGSLAASLRASALVGALGIATIFVGSPSELGIVSLFGAPLIEVGVAVSVERRSARRRDGGED